MTDQNQPAFPVTAGNQVYAKGITLRDYIAVKCFAAVWGREDDELNVRDGETVDEAMHRHWSGVAVAAFIAADAMLEARDK